MGAARAGARRAGGPALAPGGAARHAQACSTTRRRARPSSTCATASPTSDEQSKARTAELAAANAQLAEQLAALRRSLLDLNNQLEAMRGEIAKLRGNDEQVMRELSEMQRRQKDVAQAVDERLRKIEPVKVTLDGREFVVEPDEKQAYDEAMAAIRGGDFDKAVAAARRLPAPLPRQRLRQQRALLAGQRAVRQARLQGSDHRLPRLRGRRARPPACARGAAGAGQQPGRDEGHAQGARRTIDELVKTYPQSEAAQAGKQRLASLK